MPSASVRMTASENPGLLVSVRSGVAEIAHQGIVALTLGGDGIRAITVIAENRVFGKALRLAPSMRRQIAQRPAGSSGD